jgi:hypothetical protein
MCVEEGTYANERSAAEGIEPAKSQAESEQGAQAKLQRLQEGEGAAECPQRRPQVMKTGNEVPA